MRLFIAIEIAPPLRDAIATLRGSLAGVRWTDPDSYHLTLRFIGEVSDRHRLEDIHAALSTIRVPALRLLPAPPGLFAQEGGRDRLWVGIARTDALLHLRRKIDTAMRRAAGLDVERRRFQPHVTIGTLVHPPRDLMARWLAQWGALPLPPLDVTHMTLFQSLRGPDEPVYEPLASYDFTP